MILSPAEIIEKYNQMKGQRALWETHWQELTDYILPRKNTILVLRTEGEKRNVFLFDSTGVKSNQLLAGALHGMLTNPDSMWFELTTGDLELDKKDGVRLWLQQTTRDIHNVLNNSNFQTEVHELYLDLCCLGTSPMLIEEDEQYIVRFDTKFLGEVCIAENHIGMVDEVFQEFQWNAKNIIAEYGEENCPQPVIDSYKKADEKKFKVIHAVYAPQHGKKDGLGFKFISQHILVDTKTELRKKGFREFPYVVPRWEKAPGEQYGRSPGMDALPEVKVINEMTKTTLEGAQKVIDPPLQAPDDGFMTEVNTYPGGLSYYRAGSDDIIRPVFNDARIDFGFQAISDKKAAIREAFYVDQLQLQQGPQMTATEVMQRTEEKMRLLGPMLGRLQVEFLRPLIDRVFDIMLKKNKIRTIPEELAGKKIDVRYSSIVAKSQRVAEGQSIMRTIQAIEPFYNVNKDVLDNLDGDQAVAIISKIYGLPQEILRDKKDVDQIRQSRAQAQEAMMKQQQQQAQAQSIAQTLPAVAQAAR